MIRLRELTPTKFAEVGRPYLLRKGRNERVALCSAFDLLYWPGRATYEGHRLRHRLSLYTDDFADRIAVFDGSRFPINDVAFHPSEPWLAIGTGSYDGGYAFEGELLLWNIETGEHRSLLAESREVVRCRFTDAGKLAFLLRPRFEDEFGDEATGVDTYVGTTVDAFAPIEQMRTNDGSDRRLSDLRPIDPTSLGFESAQNLRSVDMSAAERQQLKQAGYEERHRAWDIAWLGDKRIGLVHDCCRLEVWDLDDGRVFIDQGAGHGVQLLVSPDRVLVHVLFAHASAPARSTLFALEERVLTEWRAFANACAFSIDERGRVLARDTGDLMRRRPRLDRVLDGSGRIVLEKDIGHYDCFNHHVRIDGSDALYFLRGTPPESHQGKRLCAIESKGSVSEVMKWDDKGEHLMDGCAAFVDRNRLVRGYRIWGPRSSEMQIELYSLPNSRSVWVTNVDADVTAMCVHAATNSVVFALTDGQLGAIDLETGRILTAERLAVEGIPSVATSIAVRAELAAIGTIDGRLLLYKL